MKLCSEILVPASPGQGYPTIGANPFHQSSFCFCFLIVFFFFIISYFFLKIFFSDADHFLKVFAESVTILLLFYALFFLARRPVGSEFLDQEPTPASLEGEVLTTGPSGTFPDHPYFTKVKLRPGGQ